MDTPGDRAIAPGAAARIQRRAMKAKPQPACPSRLFRLAAALVALLAAAGPQAWADDDDGGPASSDPGGDASRPGGFPGLGPNPGRIAVPGALQGLFGSAPARPGVELVATGLPPGTAAALRAAGFAVLSERGGVVRLRGPSGLGEAAALARLRAAAPGALADRNHRYRLAAVPDRTEAAADPGDPAPPCATPRAALVALVDTGVDPRHPDLVGVIERQESFRAPGRRAARTAHGTAVAVRLAAVMPGARIAVLDAFHATADGDAADAYDIAAALARTAEIGARIANLSFVGPRNAVLERIGAEAAAAGVLFVAAAGNDGPRAPPLYPAAHPWAIAVAAVGPDDRPWSRSAAGAHIAFAAPGVGIALPPPPGARPRAWSGTSFAAPVVTAMLARLPDPRPEALAVLARDAGPPGRDPVFGWGVVEPLPCAVDRRAGGG